MALTKATYSMIDGATLNSVDFGVTGDGTTDDTVNLQAAIDAAQATFKTLEIYGTPLISSTINITSRVRIRMQGGFGVNGSGPTGPWSFIKKAASLNGPAVVISNAAKGVVIEGGGIEGVAGNGGDGLVILGNSACIRDFSVLAMGQDGIRIGQDTTGISANNFYLDNIYCAANGRDGLHIADVITGGPSNANAGQVNRYYGQSNTRHGIYCQNVGPNTFVNPHCESNSGYGVYLDTYAQQIGLIGGDVEGNTSGNIYITSAYTVVTGTANNGSGAIRLTVADSSKFTTGHKSRVSNVLGTTEANGVWVITVIDATHIDLQGSTYVNAYVSGGSVGANTGYHQVIGTAVSTAITDNGYLTNNSSRFGIGGNGYPINATGTWTPTIEGSSGGTPTYGSRSGKWALNGNILTAWFDVTITAVGSLSGNTFVGGLPYNFDSTFGSGFVEQADRITMSGTQLVLAGRGSGFNNASLLQIASGAVTAVVSTASLCAGGNTRIRGVITGPVTVT